MEHDLYSPQAQQSEQTSITFVFRLPKHTDYVSVSIATPQGSILNAGGNNTYAVCDAHKVCRITLTAWGTENVMPFDDYMWRVSAHSDHSGVIGYSEWRHVQLGSFVANERRETITPIVTPTVEASATPEFTMIPATPSEVTITPTVIPLTPSATIEVPTMTSTPLPPVEPTLIAPTIEVPTVSPTPLSTVEPTLTPTIEVPTISPTPFPTVEPAHRSKNG
jgi:hypothetical protein